MVSGWDEFLLPMISNLVNWLSFGIFAEPAHAISCKDIDESLLCVSLSVPLFVYLVLVILTPGLETFLANFPKL